ncbi:uncharacterized protein CTRU02_207014 [Colletotrichum truncatum]|uniref:Uncharacterized protein n=1 Tax=Colletotrichum truncatum TaxID=5467 RepID=A0ACC3YZ99_COLTU|nr:uncharacterized protein CTRU02_11133 [Colletotrichum truncatum]KAF6786262.1 hypothetical protein CTRU02_11133 [Colletotrichum truncatum]
MVFGINFITGRSILGLTVAFPALLISAHIWDIYEKTRIVDWQRITSKDDASATFRQSITIKNLVNPRDHISTSDLRYADLKLPRAAQGLNDDYLLAAFIRGFFGGKVFMPERVVLQVVRRKLAFFEGLSTKNDIEQVWSVSDIPRHTLPAQGSLFFGAFQVGHVEVHNYRISAVEGENTTSSIDFVYGSDQGRFAGAHRFSITRDTSRQDVIRITYESLSCNPTTNRRFAPGFLIAFHEVYASWLFKESISQVLRVLEPQADLTKDGPVLLAGQ